MQPLNPQPLLVLFDLDDTLCDYAGARHNRLKIAFSLALASMGRDGEFDLDQLARESVSIQEHGIDHFASLLTSHGIDDPEAIRRAETWFVDNRFHGLQLFPDTVETLTAVREAIPDRHMGMVTNGPAEVQSAKIDLLDLRRFFDFVLISEEFGTAKPETAIFAEALSLGGAEPGNAVYIGDSPEFDMAGARNAGIRSIWMNPGGHPWHGEPPRPDFQVRKLPEITRLLIPSGAAEMAENR